MTDLVISEQRGTLFDIVLNRPEKRNALNKAMYEAFYGLREKPFSILPDPDYLYLGKAYFNTKKYKEAIAAYSNINTYSYISGYSDSLLIKSMIGLCHVQLNNSDKVQSTIKEFKEIGSQDSKYYLARLYLAANKQDLSLQYLKVAFEGDYGYSIGRYNTDYELVPLWDYPEFKEFIKPKDL